MNFTRLKRSCYCLIFLLPFLFICASTLTPFIVPDMNGDKLNSGGLVIFPVWYTKSSEFVIGIRNYTKIAEHEIVNGLKQKHPELPLMTSPDFLQELDNRQLSKKYVDLENMYRSTEEIDNELANEIAASSPKKFFMITTIDTIVTSSTVAYKYQADVQITTKIFEIKTANQVFAVSQYGSFVTLAEGYPYEEVIKEVCKKIAQAINMIYEQ